MILLARSGIALIAVTALTACTLGPNISYVAPLQQPDDAEVLANGMVEFITTRLPAASSTLFLDPTPPEQIGNAVTPILATALRRLGFAVAEGGQPPPTNAHHLRYLVTPLDNGDLVRLTIDGHTQGSRFFSRNSVGRLQSGGPYTVTQAEGA